MKLPPSGRVEAAVATDRSRPVLTRVFLRIVETKTGRGRNRKVTREGWLEATDSYVLAQVPVELDDDDTEGMIPVEALVEARTTPTRELAVDGEIRIQGYGKLTTFPRPEMGKFPDTERLFSTEDSPVASVGLNAKFLAKLAEALGTDTVRLDIMAPRKAIRVTPASGNGGRGLLMPILVPELPKASSQDDAPASRPSDE